MPLSILQVRALLLAAQGLLEPPTTPASPDAVLAAIRRMRVLQIDTIHVVARSPYLVLWSRLGAYPSHWLDDLLAQNRLFEYWAHAACFIPIEDYPLYRRSMLDGKSGWLNEHNALAELVMQRIQQEGPLRSADFESEKAAGGWWNWKEEKLALEQLFTRGDLMIRARKNFQRIYDLRQRVLPNWDDALTPTREEVRRTHLLRTVYCLGVTRAHWAADYFRVYKTGIAKELANLAKEGALITETVDGWLDPVYIHPENIPLLAKAQAGELVPTYTTLLSPFDPLVWDRQRARELFKFDYTIECYTPEAKRRYGYFSLPILQRGRLVGRLDAKAHRQKKTFEVRNLVLEAGIDPDEQLVNDLSQAVRACAAWHQTSQVTILRSQPVEFAAMFDLR